MVPSRNTLIVSLASLIVVCSDSVYLFSELFHLLDTHICTVLGVVMLRGTVFSVSAPSDARAIQVCHGSLNLPQRYPVKMSLIVSPATLYRQNYLPDHISNMECQIAVLRLTRVEQGTPPFNAAAYI